MRHDYDDPDWDDARAEAAYERKRDRARMNYILLGPEYHEDWMDEEDAEDDEEDDDDDE